MKKFIFFLVIITALSSCNETSFLEEEPKDFMSTDNAFKTETDFNMTVYNLYNLIRTEFYGYDENKPFDYIYGTDLIFDGEPGTTNRHGNMLSAYNPTASIPKFHWDSFYKIISEANILISRSAQSTISDEQKKLFEAKGRFFRGLSYRTLAYLYGGVPIELNEVSTPKNNYTRATKEATLAQAEEDVKFAAENLPDIKDVEDCEISSPAAYHLLSEIYLAEGKNQEAVEAATKVISNPALALMTSRFGTRVNDPGDVYWDLFRRGNQNRKGGNTEGIWVIQFETDVPGGGSQTATLKLKGNYMLERHCGPQVGNVRLPFNGKKLAPFSWPTGDYTGGRGIGWGVSTKYFTNTIWESDFKNDIRNSNYNFVRKFPVNNQSFKEATGIDTIDVDNPPAGLIVGQGGSTVIPNRFLYAYQSKATTPFNHPAEMYEDASTYKLKSIAGTTFCDQYMFRLSETYLLRAEAYLMLGDKVKAANDINVVRARAHAKPVSPENVDLDYILDERMRELGVEEKRRLTLMRLGKLYDRVMKCNPYYANPQTNGDGVGMQKTYNLWPIPQSAIEANNGAVLEQNPGYE